MLASIVNLYRLRRALTGQPGLEVRLYRALRSSRKRRHRVRTNPRWIVHYAIPYRVAGRSAEFRDRVRRAFEMFDAPLGLNVRRDLCDSLVLLCKEPARFRQVSALWSDLLRRPEAQSLSPLQWRWLSQISGMMGLFRACDVSRLRSAESHLLPQTYASADQVARVRALCELDRALEALTDLSKWMDREGSGVSSVRLQTTHHYLRRLCRLGSSSGGLALRDEHLSRLHALVGGQRVGIVGNSAAMLTTEIPEDVDVLVRLNAFTALDRHLAMTSDRKPLIVYLNSGNSMRLLRELNDGDLGARALVAASSLIALRGSTSFPSGDLFTTPSIGPPIHDHGPVIGCQAAFDVIVAGASSVTLLGFDFNQSSLFGENPWDMCRKLGDQGMLNQFEFLRQLHSAGLLICDDLGAATIGQTTSSYAALLEELYGDWSSGASHSAPQQP